MQTLNIVWPKQGATHTALPTATTIIEPEQVSQGIPTDSDPALGLATLS
jgi:hypothetical protein